MSDFFSRGATVLCLALAIGCSKDPNTAKVQAFDSGTRYFAAKKYNEAIVEYRRAIQLDPKFGEARAKLGEAYLQNGEIASALRETVRAADLLPAQDDVHGEILVEPHAPRLGFLALVSHCRKRRFVADGSVGCRTHGFVARFADRRLCLQSRLRPQRRDLGGMHDTGLTAGSLTFTTRGVWSGSKSFGEPRLKQRAPSPSRPAFSKVDGLPQATQIGGCGFDQGFGSTFRGGMPKWVPS